MQYKHSHYICYYIKSERFSSIYIYVNMRLGISSCRSQQNIHIGKSKIFVVKDKQCSNSKLQKSLKIQDQSEVLKNDTNLIMNHFYGDMLESICCSFQIFSVCASQCEKNFLVIQQKWLGCYLLYLDACVDCMNVSSKDKQIFFKTV